MKTRGFWARSSSGRERSAEEMDDASGLTEHDERALEAIRRQLDIEFAWPSGLAERGRDLGAAENSGELLDAGDGEPASEENRASNRARPIGTGVARLLLWSAAGVLVTVLYLKHVGPGPGSIAGREVPRPEAAGPGTTAHEPTPLPFMAPVTRSSPSRLETRPQTPGGGTEPTTLHSDATGGPAEPSAPPVERPVPPNQRAVVTPVRPQSARGSSARSYWVQVGAFKNPEAARRLASRVREQNPSVSNRRVVVYAVPIGTALSRVRVGPFSDRAEAAAKLRELRTQGYNPSIAEERG